MPPVKGKVTKASKWICVYKDNVLVGTYPSMTKAAEAFDVRVQNVWRAINVYQTSLKGYVFKLMNKNDSLDENLLYERANLRFKKLISVILLVLPEANDSSF